MSEIIILLHRMLGLVIFLLYLYVDVDKHNNKF